MRAGPFLRRASRAVLALAALSAAMMATPGGGARAGDLPALSQMADGSTVDLGTSGVLHIYTARLPSGGLPRRDAVVSALIAIHGFPRDANRTLGAAALAAKRAGRESDTIAVAPLFQVSAAGRCEFPGNPGAQPGDAVWTCDSWLDGGAAEGAGPTSFGAMDLLVADLARRWPHLRTITVAGFSAGAQFVQRYIGCARPAGGQRYVVSDPGTWLYCEPERPVPRAGAWGRCRDAACDFTWRGAGTACSQANRWKYGTEGLPAVLGSSADAARARYAAADITYLEGALDAGRRPDTYYGLLDKSCAAELQGPDRLHRGLAYAAYDRRFLSADHTLAIVPGCAHEVTCVFPSPTARAALFAH